MKSGEILIEARGIFRLSFLNQAESVNKKTYAHCPTYLALGDETLIRSGNVPGTHLLGSSSKSDLQNKMILQEPTKIKSASSDVGPNFLFFKKNRSDIFGF